MYSLRYFLTPEMSLLDGRRNQVTAVNIMEDVTPIGFPFAFANFSVLCCVERQATDVERPDARLKVRWQDTPLFEGPLPLNFQGVLRTRAILDLHGVVVPGPGRLTLTVDIGEQRDFATTALDVLAPSPSSHAG